ncbi:MAG: right-handed parallel beta-helix repeat-containing protein, partial [Candidatus Limnocylindrales bacterium]
PFLGRTPSGQIVINGQNGTVVSGHQFVNLPAGQDAIVVENSSNVTITANDFSGNTGDIYVVDSSNVTVTWNRYRNVGDGSTGSGASNFIQFSRTTGGYIAHNKGIGGNTEDIVSIYESQGASAASPIVIEDNAFEGTNWSSDSGSGSMLGDAGGSHIVIRDNTFLNPGQVGIGVSGGSDIHVLGNVIYGVQRANSNVGIYVWNQSSGTCSAIEVASNSVRWYAASGAENPYWDGSNCGVVAGVSTNNWHTSLDPNALQVSL